MVCAYFLNVADDDAAFERAVNHAKLVSIGDRKKR